MKSISARAMCLLAFLIVTLLISTAGASTRVVAPVANRRALLQAAAGAPAPEAEAPTPEPAAPVPEPAAPAPEPVAPVPVAAAPVPEAAAPVPEPAAPVPEPAAPVPEPAAPVAEPAAPAPEPGVPLPAATTPEVEAPAPEVEAPMPEMEAPMTEMEAPMPEMEAPMPEMEAPMPEMEAPMPEMEAPMPEMEAPMAGMNMTNITTPSEVLVTDSFLEELKQMNESVFFIGPALFTSPAPEGVEMLTPEGEEMPCTDTPPDDLYTCEEQKAFGKCYRPYMIEGNFCAQSCGLPPCPPLTPEQQLSIPSARRYWRCTDVPPNAEFTCEEQKEYGQCDSEFMVQGDFCSYTCERAPCPAREVAASG